MKEYLGFAEGMMIGPSRGQNTSADNYKYFDQLKAAEIIRERAFLGNDLWNADLVFSAGLVEDWGYTSGEIFANGAIVPEEDTYVYLSSSWATPVLDIDGEEIECWKFGKDIDKGIDTPYWPEHAKSALLNGIKRLQ